jgi:hypothetical protein
MNTPLIKDYLQKSKEWLDKLYYQYNGDHIKFFNDVDVQKIGKEKQDILSKMSKKEYSYIQRLNKKSENFIHLKTGSEKRKFPHLFTI